MTRLMKDFLVSRAAPGRTWRALAARLPFHPLLEPRRYFLRNDAELRSVGPFHFAHGTLTRAPAPT